MNDYEPSPAVADLDRCDRCGLWLVGVTRDRHGPRARWVVTDLAQSLDTVIEELLPDAFHNTAHYANNRVECDHGRLKARLRPMRGLKTDRTAAVVISGHALVQNLRRGHYQLGVEALPRLRVAAAFDELTETI